MIPHIVNGSSDVGPEFAEVIFWQLKKALISVIWGDFFPQHFVELFMELSESKSDPNSISNDEDKPQRLKIRENTSVTDFKKIHDGCFDLREKYILN